MSLRIPLVAVALAAAACGSEVDGPPPPTACQKADRNGTYRQSFTVQGGNCGPIDDQVVSSDPGPSGTSTPGAKCSLTSERWSDGDCKLERVVACSSPEFASTTTAVTRQQTQNGSTLSGTMTVNVRARDGSSCSGTYGVAAVRQ